MITKPSSPTLISSLRRYASTSLLVNPSNYPRAFCIRDCALQKQTDKKTSLDPLLSKIRRKEPVRVTVTGAAGAIGYALLFRIANGELLGKDQPVELNCLELEAAMNPLKGVAMELEDCAFPLLKNVTITSDEKKAFDGCEVALLIGSKPRSKGMERSDLLKENGKIFKKTGETLNNVAAKYCRVTVVGNPCNTNCLIASHHAHNIPSENFTAMTRLDHDRGIGLLQSHTLLPSNEINYFAIWGNHSANMFPDLRYTTIHGISYQEIIGHMKYDNFYKKEFIPKVQQRGSYIIKVRGASSAASAANACIAHTRDWILGSNQPDWNSMAVVSKGEYGVPAGLIFSYPVWNRNGHYEIASVPLALDDYQQFSIERNIKELEEERDSVASYLS